MMQEKERSVVRPQGIPARETEGHRLTHGREGKSEHVGRIQGDPQVGCWKNEECLQQSILFPQGKTRLSVSEGCEGVMDV